LFTTASTTGLLISIASAGYLMMLAKADVHTTPVNLDLCKKSQGEYAAPLQIVRQLRGSS
jgi:hypothetical protein